MDLPEIKCIKKMKSLSTDLWLYKHQRFHFFFRTSKYPFIPIKKSLFIFFYLLKSAVLPKLFSYLFYTIIHPYPCIYIHIHYTYAYSHTYRYTHTHTYSYRHTHTYTHTLYYTSGLLIIIIKKFKNQKILRLVKRKKKSILFCHIFIRIKTGRHSSKGSFSCLMITLIHETQSNGRSCNCICVCALTQTFHHKQDVTQGQFSSGVHLVWIQSFFFSLIGYHTKVKEPSMPYYLPIAGKRIVGFIPFWKDLVLCEM